LINRKRYLLPAVSAGGGRLRAAVELQWLAEPFAVTGKQKRLVGFRVELLPRLQYDQWPGKSLRNLRSVVPVCVIDEGTGARGVM
jgi:hypothetical protein